ncbi:hypothetical protein PGTUg99_006455 [Puccinia graminis f. sp. tritici]|uniref:Uncharacterized protein n=1 Tax=Puccinia graminis f. sp. tritici TaxID=56615 RepID=A0A5B0MNJ3_PUCGR|nr:hypothetical protein PGTUg99_006455 [Puccinia graminis f. sp. tritici]
MVVSTLDRPPQAKGRLKSFSARNHLAQPTNALAASTGSNVTIHKPGLITNSALDGD